MTWGDIKTFIKKTDWEIVKIEFKEQVEGMSVKIQADPNIVFVFSEIKEIPKDEDFVCGMADLYKIILESKKHFEDFYQMIEIALPHAMTVKDKRQVRNTRQHLNKTLDTLETYTI